MEISNLFKNALSYPLSDYKKLIILGIVTIISQLTVISSVINNGFLEGISFILAIITFVFSLIIGGYVISVIKNTLDGSDEIPSFEWVSNFVTGIKYLIMEIIYFIIPLIIVLIVGAITGLYGLVDEVVNQMGPLTMDTALNQTAVQSAINEVPSSTLASLSGSLTVTVVIAIILTILFTFFAIIGSCRLADTGSLKEALNIKKVWNDISAIGWGSFIIWFIIWCILIIVLGAISSAIAMIPIIGGIIVALLVGPFITLFVARAIGLVYLEK